MAKRKVVLKSAIQKFKEKQKEKRKSTSAKFVYRKLSKLSKKQKVLEIRDSNNNIISLVKASELRKEGISKEQAVKRFIAKNSFKKEVKERTVFSTGFVQTISNKPVGTKKRSQIGADIWLPVGREMRKFSGFSDLGELGDKGREQASARALKGASNAGAIKHIDSKSPQMKIVIERLQSKFTYYYINFNFLSEEKERGFASA